MSTEGLRVLLVEDNAGDAELVREALEGVARPRPVVLHATTLAGARHAPCDVMLLDLNLPDSHGLDTLRRARAAGPATPIVVLTGHGDDAVALAALREGAEDYLVKGCLDGPTMYRAIRYAVERNRAAEHLRRALVESPVPAIMLAEDGEVLHLSRSWTEITGYTAEELPTHEAWTARAFPPEFKEEMDRRNRARFALQRSGDEGESVVRTRAGAERIWDFSTAPLGRLRDGRRAVISVAKDVTGRKRAEQALRESEQQLREHAARLEAVNRQLAEAKDEAVRANRA
ncbi:MAG TPA: PAS domain S-box protein, partial [Gemmata sp.]